MNNSIFISLKPCRLKVTPMVIYKGLCAQIRCGQLVAAWNAMMGLSSLLRSGETRTRMIPTRCLCHFPS